MHTKVLVETNNGKKFIESFDISDNVDKNFIRAFDSRGIDLAMISYPVTLTYLEGDDKNVIKR